MTGGICMRMFTPSIELEERYIYLQNRMISLGMRKGLTHQETLKCSQELDAVLNKIQMIYHAPKEISK